MKLYPAIDLRGGQAVRLYQGDYDRMTVYNADPVAQAQQFIDAGAKYLHVVDLDGAKDDTTANLQTIAAIAKLGGLKIEVGGGIHTLDDFDRVLKCGADKVSVNSGAIRNPGIIPAAAQKYGNQCVVLSADIKRVDGKFMLFAKGGRENTGINALDWLEQGVKNGAGELVVNSIDTDGVKSGFDLELLDAVAARCAVPIIASGGAGKKEDFLELFRNHPAVDAGLAASIFHTKQVEINDLKRYLRENGVEMRV